MSECIRLVIASDMDVRGKTALVTGASKGIGLATARALVEAGMNVALNARSEAELRRAAQELNEVGPGRALVVEFDVRDLAAQREGVKRTVAQFGGVGARRPVDERDAETGARIIDTNLTGVFYSVSAAVDELKRSHGMIVTIGSLAGTNFFAGGAAYNASKFGLLGFTQAVMLALRPHGVRVSTIMPGSVATGFSDRDVSEADGWKIQPQDVAQTVLYLARMPARTLPSKIEMRPAQTGPVQTGPAQTGQS